MTQALVLSARAFHQMAEDALSHPDTETGGILVGRRAAGQFIVPFVVLAGDRAERTADGFAPDSSHQQLHLDYLHQRFRVDFLGDFHRHPGSFDRPSLHDLVTARGMVSEPEWNSPVLCFPILTLDVRTVRMRAYLMTRETLKFEEIDIEYVEDTDSRIQAVLLGEVLIVNKREEVSANGVSLDRARPRRPLRQLQWI